MLIIIRLLHFWTGLHPGVSVVRIFWRITENRNSSHGFVVLTNLFGYLGLGDADGLDVEPRSEYVEVKL